MHCHVIKENIFEYRKAEIFFVEESKMSEQVSCSVSYTYNTF